MRGTPFLALTTVLALASVSTAAQPPGRTKPKRPADPQRGPIVPPEKPKPVKPDFEGFELGHATTPTPRDPNGPEIPPDDPVDTDEPVPAAPQPGTPDPSRVPAYAHTRGTPPGSAPESAPSVSGGEVNYTPLVIIAAIHRIVSFPIPFQAALIPFPEDGSRVEIANATITAEHPGPFDVNLEFRAPGHPPKPQTSRAYLGWLPLSPPSGYEHGSVLVTSATPLIAWRISAFEEALFGIDRQRFFRRFVAPVGSKYRLDIRALDQIPWDRLPANPKAISEDPILARPWRAFLDAAQQTKM